MYKPQFNAYKPFLKQTFCSKFQQCRCHNNFLELSTEIPNFKVRHCTVGCINRKHTTSIQTEKQQSDPHRKADYLLDSKQYTHTYVHSTFKRKNTNLAK